MEKTKGRPKTFNTVIGGIVSVITQILFWASFVYYSQTMLSFGNNSITNEDISPDWD